LLRCQFNGNGWDGFFRQGFDLIDLLFHLLCSLSFGAAVTERISNRGVYFLHGAAGAVWILSWLPCYHKCIIYTPRVAEVQGCERSKVPNLLERSASASETRSAGCRAQHTGQVASAPQRPTMRARLPRDNLS